MSHKNNAQLWTFVIVLFVVAIILYAFTLGQWDLISDKDESKESLLDKRKRAETRHQKLSLLLEKKKILKQKLDKRFKIIYVTVRCFFILLYFFANLVLYRAVQKDIGAIMNWNGILIGSLAFLNFLIFGTEMQMKNVINYFKTAIENRLCKKYIDIDKQIERHKRDLSGLENELK